MKKRGKVRNRILSAFLALMIGVTGIPMNVFASDILADEDIVLDEISNDTQVEAPKVPDAVPEETSEGEAPAQMVKVSVNTGITRDEVTGEMEWHEDPYPLELFIINPDPDIEKEDPSLTNDTQSPEDDGEAIPNEEEFELFYADGDGTSGYYTYNTSGTNATVTKYDGSEANVTIPDEFDGYTVTAIGSNAFKGNTSVKSVSMPSTVKSIGSSAFENCTSLRSIDLSSSLTSIGGSAFSSDTALTEITIPSTVTSIGSSAFKDSVEKITFESGIKSIPSSACYNATSLETVVIPSTVTSIGSNAFYQCTKLTTASLPDGLTSIGSSAFYYCSSLTGIVLPDTLKEIGSSAFYSATQVTRLSIPASVTSIGNNAFYNSVKEIIFKDGITTIPNNACYNATALESVTIPDTVTRIGNYAFDQCGNLTGVTLPANLTSIGDHAFYQCKLIESVQLPDGLTYIGSYAFAYCSALKDMTLPASLTEIGAYAFYMDEKLTDISIPASVTKIGRSAFYNSAKNIVFADGITEIPENACYGATYLETVTVPDTVTKIGNYAFYQNKKLTDIQLPGDLATIGDHAFYQCTEFEATQLPAGVTSIGRNAFYGCSKLSSMVLPEGLTTIDYGAFYNCSNLETVLIPSTVTKMGQSIFYNSAKSIIFANGITAIPDNACDGATNLTEVVLPSGLKSIGKRAFYGCTLLVTAAIPEGTKSVGESAFYGDTALTIRIPDSLEEIGKDAFTGCNIIKKCGKNAEWEYDPEEKAITITGTGEIGSGSGNVCDPFTDDIQFVDIKEGITRIGDHSFEGMDGLIGVVIGDNVKEIGTQAFDNCGTLERVELPKDIEKIDDKAFHGCESVDTIILTGNIPQIEDTALPDQDITVHYPKDSVDIEKTKDQFENTTWKPWDNTLPERDVVLVLDVSGSMSGDRISNLKKAVIAFAQKVGGRLTNTHIGIVTYASDAKKLMSFSTDVARMKVSAERLSANGSTYYLKGFDVAEEMLASSTSSVRSIILFSDGAPSDDRSTIISRSDGFRDSGYYTYCVGLAPSDSNRELLISVAGDEENYFEADDIDSLIERFLEMTEDLGRSGICGDNVKWKYNDSSKELVISLNNKSGRGSEMDDFDASNAPPWNAYADNIEKIRIDSGVTYVGTNAFSKLSKVATVRIDKSVTDIGSGAFSGCTGLSEVNYTGTEDDWKQIAIGSNNEPLLNAKKNFGSKGEGAVTGVLVKPSSVSININDKTTLSAEVYPKTATNKSVSWTSSDNSIATVSRLGKVTPKAEGTVTITATTDDGGFIGTSIVTVTNNIPVIKQLSLGGSKTGIKLDDSIPLIGGKNYRVSLPAALPVSCVVEDNKIKIGINVRKECLYSYNSTEGVTTTTNRQNFKEQFEDIKNQYKKFQGNALKADLMRRDADWIKNIQDEKFLKANMPGADTSVDFNCIGYVEGAWDDSRDAVGKIGGSLILTVSGSTTLQHQMVIWVIPVTVNCQFDASGQLIADIGYDFSKAEWYGDIALAASFGIEPYVGVGFGQWISGGVYGRAQTDFNIILLSMHDRLGLKNWTLQGEVGVKGYFAKKSATFPIIGADKDKYYIYKDYEILLGTDQSVSPDVLHEDKASLEDRLIISTLDAKEGLQRDTSGPDGTLVSDVYNAAKPELITANGVTMLVYVADDIGRSSLNQTKLVYSIYNPVSGTYSSPRAVLDDGTADFDPEVYTDGNDIYVVWLDSSKTYTTSEDPELNEYMKTFSTHIARYDAANNAFEDLGSPQVNANYTYMARLYKSGETLQLVWVENRDDSLLGLSGNNAICRAAYNSGVWSVEDEISGLYSVTSLDMGRAESDSDVSIAYTIDKDNDLTTAEQDLYVRKSNNSRKVQTGNISSVKYTNLPGVDGVVIAVNKDGGLYYWNGSALTSVLADGTMNNGTRFEVSDDKVVYFRSSDESRNLAVASYDNGNWGNTLLTDGNGYIDSFSVDAGRVSYLYSDASSKANGDWNVTSSIRVLDSLAYNDVELETADYAAADVCAGNELPLSLYIRNNGSSRLRRVRASVSYGGNEITSSDITVNLMPGEVKPYDYSFKIPATLSSGGDFTVTTTCENDRIGANNSRSLSLMKADIEVTAGYDATGMTPYINVNVENRGLVDSNMILTVKDENGETLFSENGTVKAGEYVTYSKAYKAGKEQILTITAKGDVEEYYEDNNTAWLKVGGSSGDPGPIVYGSFSVGFAHTGSDPYDGMSYNTDNSHYETVYTGSAIIPEIVVTGLNGRLTEGVDYTVKFSNNVKVGAKPAVITVSGKGNYAGKASLEFYILKPDLAVAKEKGLLTLGDTIKVQSGKKLTPVIAYRDYILKAADMDISNKGVINNNTTVDITGKGNFTGTLGNVSVRVITPEETKAYTIKTAMKAGVHTYNAEAQTLTYSAPDAAGELTVTAGSSRTILIKGRDYNVKYYSNTNAGTASVVVTGMGDYIGSETKTFKIQPDKKSEITASLAKSGSVEYDPQGAMPPVTVQSVNELLTLGEDYTVTYSNNKKTGKAKYTVKFLGNYKGHAAISNKTFTISPASFGSAKVAAADMLYTKAGKYLSTPYVTINGVQLSTKDYTVKYFDGSNEIKSKDKIALDGDTTSKKITIKVKGRGNYQSQTVTSTYTVFKSDAAPVNLSKAKIVAKKKDSKGNYASVSKQEYTGEGIEPDIKVLVIDGKTWKEVPTSAYKITYINNVNKGKATILISGNGKDAVGSKVANFQIGARNIGLFGKIF